MKNKTEKKSRKGLKVFLVFFIIFILLGLSAGGIWVYGTYFEKDKDPEKAYYIELQEKFSEVSFDEKKNIPFINNEIIVIAAEVSSYEDIEVLAEEYDGYVAERLDDIGVYKIKFNEENKYSELEKTLKDILRNPSVENAFISTVTLLDGETAEDSEDDDKPTLEVKKAVYPEDPWKDTNGNDCEWDSVPEGTNWGLEAVHAPEAWGYLEDISQVKVGLIDTMVDMSHSDLTVSGAFASFTDTSTGKTESGSVTNAEITPHFHGTHVAGIMNAQWNKTGTSGILGSKGELYYGIAYSVEDGVVINDYTTPFNLFRAIKLLADNGVRAINISLNTGRLIGFAASHGNKAAIDHLTSQADQVESLLSRYIKNRQQNGLDDFVICVAAGNVNTLLYVENEDAMYGWEEYDPSNNISHIYATPQSGGAQAIYNNFLLMIDNEDVSKRIICVGSVANAGEGIFRYSDFSNLGDRVDIVAPGEDILSLFPENTCESIGGTSMATPHVTAACGLIFGANPSLSGPEVKRIVCSSVNGRYYHGDDYSGLLDLNKAVRNALMTKENSVNTVIEKGYSGLDLCFVVDTTGSMGDDIRDAKDNMTRIVESLDLKTPDFRVAIVDYRDFNSRSGDSSDYPAKTQLSFTSDTEEIKSRINALSLGDGGDANETVYSGLAEALSLSWRDEARKVIIILGDAPPLDPEPETEYTYEMIREMLYNADMYVDTDNSDNRVLGDAEDSLICVYSIGTSPSDAAADFFESISGDTGGSFRETEDASDVSDAIIDSIDEIDISLISATVNFGEKNSFETVMLTDANGESFSFILDEKGCFTLNEMADGDYTWEIERLAKSGDIELSKKHRSVKAEEETEWYSFILILWERHRVPTVLAIAGAILLIILIIVLSVVIKRKIRKHKEKKRAGQNIPTLQMNPPIMQGNTRAVTPTPPAMPHTRQNVQNTPPASYANRHLQNPPKSATIPENTFCGFCGNKMQKGETFCGTCGKKQ